MAAWLHAVQGDWQPRFARGGHRLQLRLDGTMRLALRPAVLGEIVNELLENALLHAPIGDQPLAVLLHVHADAGEYHLVVADDGVGVAADALALVFDPFYTTARSRGHIGLGLHRAQILATRVLGGRLVGQPREGGGSTFILRLPHDVGRFKPMPGA